MFIYRPHVHQLDGTITPDLVVDRLAINGHEVPNVLCDRVVLAECGATCTPAVVLFGAGYGTLMGLGFAVTTADLGPAHLCLVGRAAWRLADVSNHAERLQMELRWRQGDVDATHRVSLASGRWVDPARGVAVCWIEPAWRTPFYAQWFSVGLHDPVRNRALTHQVAQPRRAAYV